MKPFTIIFLESSLELVPREIWDHPQVRKTAKRYEIDPSELILDKSLHYHAMEVLPQKWKRGRPDILHTSLLVATDTPLFEKGVIRIYFHVVDGRVFQLKPGVRIPKHLERFKGLMAQLLRLEKVPPSGEPLIFKTHDSLREFVKEQGGLILLWERGVKASLSYVVARAYYTGYPIGIGAFPRGDFKRSTLRKAKEKYAIMEGRPLKTWGVVGRLIYTIERVMGFNI